MSLEDQLARQIDPGVIATVDAIEASDAEAHRLVDLEAKSLDMEVRREQIADMSSLRNQREEYAEKVFKLVFIWICALFLLLLAQCRASGWRPLSDGVLIALISCTSANLIGSLLIVLKYIFRLPDAEIPARPPQP